MRKLRLKNISLLPHVLESCRTGNGSFSAGTMLATQQAHLLRLASRLRALSGDYLNRESESAGPSYPIQNADAIVSHIEVNDAHGVGILLKQLFSGQSGLISIRSRDYYGGRQEFGEIALRLTHESSSRDAVFSKVLLALGDATVKRILCVPYFADDARTAIALKEIYGIPMCTWLMDDQNIFAGGIPDQLMRELLQKSRLRLAISAEMREAYQQKYGLPIWWLPPLVPDHFIAREIVPLPEGTPKASVMIGNIWSARWKRALCQAVEEAGLRLTWFCNEFHSGAGPSAQHLANGLIEVRAPLAEPELVALLRNSWFAVVPTGTLDKGDDRENLTRLSLPSRLVYICATSQLPILVLGSPESAAASFVRKFGLGIVCPYDGSSLRRAARTLLDPENNLAFRRNALAVGPFFSDCNADEWIWRSLAEGQPVNFQYEQLLASRRPSPAVSD